MCIFSFYLHYVDETVYVYGVEMRLQNVYSIYNHTFKTILR